MTQLLTALDLKDGKRVESLFTSYVSSRPLQVLSREKKDETWCKMNMDWLEMVGIEQIRKQAKRMVSNYKMAHGIIERNDYVLSEHNEYSNIVESVMEEDELSTELKNYPIVPIVINTLLSEFAKRNTDVSYFAIDSDTINEILEKKQADIERILLSDANNKLKLRLMQYSGDTNSEEYQQLLQMVNNPQALRQLPEIEDFYKNNYRTIYEEWAQHHHNVDVERFRIYELEINAFLDLLVNNKEFWHFRMLEDDYDIELWDTITTFYHRSPSTKYVSNCSYVGNIQFLTLQEVIDKYGRFLNDDELNMLENMMPSQEYNYAITNRQNDGTFYNTALSYEQNSIKYGGVDLRRHNLLFDTKFTSDFDSLLKGSEDSRFNSMPYLRVTTAYWISYRKMGLYTAIDDNGNKIEKIVTEDFKVTTNPIYNTNLINEKSERTLVHGEHVEWVWMREVWGGIKIGHNSATYYSQNNDNFIPVYIGINNKKISPLPFQFKGDFSIFGAKLPVEGIIDNYRYTHSMSLVDMLKPYQIGYNIVNNQIADMLLDEIGTVIVLDQNTLPKHSLGEDWGQTPYANAYIAMKNFQILPLDTSLRNTESSINFNQYQKLDLSQTERLLSRINLSQYFKMQALEAIGVTPQRLGTPIGQRQTATEVENAVVSSYAQTEKYFITHCDNIMPRVHEMRTQLAQYYVSTKPSYRMQIMLKNKTRALFSMEQTDLLNREFNVYVTTKANYRAMIEELKRVLLSNPNTGATIYDLADIVKIQTFSELESKMKEIRERTEKNMYAQQEHEEKLKQMEIENHMREKLLEYNYEAQQKELDRRNNLLIAQIRAAGYMSLIDHDKNRRSDFIDYMEQITKSQEYKDTMTLKEKVYDAKTSQAKEKLDIEKEKLEISKQKNLINLQIARENKNKYDSEE